MSDLLFESLRWVTRLIELAGVVVIITGCMTAGVGYIRDQTRPFVAPGPYRRLRAGMGRSILLGLELLVAADIIGTVALEPTLESLAVLAGIVLIRILLSLSLEVEIEGRWPWQRGPADSIGK